MRERQSMLAQSLHQLHQQGYRNMRAHDLPGYEEPGELLVPVLNVHTRPDIVADGLEGRGNSIWAVVEVSSGLGELSCGRRWRTLAHWAQEQGGTFLIFVHSEDRERAMTIAEYWHLSGECLVPLTRH